MDVKEMVKLAKMVAEAEERHGIIDFGFNGHPSVQMEAKPFRKAFETYKVYPFPTNDKWTFRLSVVVDGIEFFALSETE